MRDSQRPESLTPTDRLILAGVKAGMSQAQIAEAIGIDRATVHRRIKRIIARVQTAA